MEIDGGGRYAHNYSHAFPAICVGCGSFLHLLICRPGRVNVNCKPTIEVATVGDSRVSEVTHVNQYDEAGPQWIVLGVCFLPG